MQRKSFPKKPLKIIRNNLDIKIKFRTKSFLVNLMEIDNFSYRKEDGEGIYINLIDGQYQKILNFYDPIAVKKVVSSLNDILQKFKINIAPEV